MSTPETRIDPANLPLFNQPPATTPSRGARGLAGSMHDPGPEAPSSRTGYWSAPPTQPEPQPEPAGPATHADLLDDEDADGEVDWSIVGQLRTALYDRQQAQEGTAEAPMQGTEAERMIDDEISAYSQRRLGLGQRPLSESQRERLARAIHDSLFGLGRMQQLVDLDGLENLEVRGSVDNVWLDFADGRLVKGPPVADSQEDLVQQLRLLAEHNGSGTRAFSPASPLLNLSLPDFSRLSASAWVHDGIMVTIRKHNYVDVDVDDLVGNLTLSYGTAAFLRAAIAAGINVVVAGLPGWGKTTLIRALLNTLPPEVPIGTIESDFELGLHRLPERHYRVWAAESKPGTGERDAAGRPIGEVTMSDLLAHSLRANVDRIVVGEVRGKEILPMFEAMQAGKGSVSTIHATSARDAVERMVTCALQAGPEVTTTFAYRQVAQHMNLVVHIGGIDERPRGGRRHRFITEIDALSTGDQIGTGVAHEPIFEPGPDGRAVPTGARPPWLHRLVDHGFDTDWLNRTRDSYAGSLPLLGTEQETS